MSRRSSEAVEWSRYAQSGAIAFGDTIVSVPHCQPLRSLCVEEGDTLPAQLSSVQELFKIRLEPMYLHEARHRISMHGRPIAPRRAELPQHSQVVPGQIASAS